VYVLSGDAHQVIHVITIYSRCLWITPKTITPSVASPKFAKQYSLFTPIFLLWKYAKHWIKKPLCHGTVQNRMVGTCQLCCCSWPNSHNWWLMFRPELLIFVQNWYAQYLSLSWFALWGSFQFFLECCGLEWISVPLVSYCLQLEKLCTFGSLGKCFVQKLKILKK